MDRLIDEIVKVSVSDAIAAATPTSVNTAAVLGVSTASNAATQVLFDQASVETAYGTRTIRMQELRRVTMTDRNGKTSDITETIKNLMNGGLTT